MASAFYRAVREAARREVPLLAAGNTTALQAAKALADRLAAERSVEDAAAWPISHPRCQRVFGPRPDVRRAG
ncbi:hypothetical protein [Streptomyces jeddahensis]|uniref:Uncharacterized protein n=1 Tax=Streptomyces jeddahensis TaxID=1716141 RepID=A0A177HH31_9ACTN|nr:hypothetical protein [Streptomyces jeddahensis]OAH10231.1 hypothetical protein STSP_64870 [Streptomyces jeddahensis]